MVVGDLGEVRNKVYLVFYLPLPDSLFRIQRREYYRLTLYPSERLHCMISADRSQANGQVEVPVMDISGGGIRLFCTSDDIEFVLGQIYEGCQINLPEVGKISVTMMVKNMISISAQTGQVTRRVGCEFRDVDTASGILLQRYVTKMQRLRAAA